MVTTKSEFLELNERLDNIEKKLAEIKDNIEKKSAEIKQVSSSGESATLTCHKCGKNFAKPRYFNFSMTSVYCPHCKQHVIEIVNRW